MVNNRDFREFIGLLNENGVKYLVIGGYAVAYHGYPRYTKDIDFWIWGDPENARKITETIQKFGFASLGIKVDDFLTPENVIQLGYPPARIDLLTALKDLNFETCYEKRVVEKFDDLEINFIDLESLIKSKLSAGRPQDKVDVQKLKDKQ
ncbi:MAG: nucleotidyltransferase [Saprospiraceae bacterium]